MYGVKICRVIGVWSRSLPKGVRRTTLYKTGPGRFSILADTGNYVDVYYCLFQGRDSVRRLSESPCGSRVFDCFVFDHAG